MCTSTSTEAASATVSRLLPLLEPHDLQVHKPMTQMWVQAVSPPQTLVIYKHTQRWDNGRCGEGSWIFFQKNIMKILSAKIRGPGFDVPGDREKHLETRKKKVRKQQVGVIDSTAVLAMFPQLAVAVSIP